MLLRTVLLQPFYSVRSVRASSWNVWNTTFYSAGSLGLGVDDPVWDHSSFSKNRDQLLDGEIAA